MKPAQKNDFPVADVRQYLEPGPVLLVTSALGNERDIMTLGWHTVMEFSPSLVGCMISAGNNSHRLIKKSSECVLNLPAFALLDTLVAIGNCSGADVDKFAEFSLTPQPASEVKAPLIAECHACFECRLYDDTLVDNFNFFIFEVVKAQVASSPKYPQTVHYCGDGEFMLSGKRVSRRSQFRPEML
ncbi:flavin reductase family protein [Kalamiella sp. sgz302252]|uniref:flavin reductase family protein n=1 Tax=Pantoea sp. sgz302252 TaxID=3341827 RepID=UPI0036D323D7